MRRVSIGLSVVALAMSAAAQPPDQPAPPIVGPGDTARPITPPPPGQPRRPQRPLEGTGGAKSPVERPPVGTTQPPAPEPQPEPQPEQPPPPVAPPPPTPAPLPPPPPFQPPPPLPPPPLPWMGSLPPVPQTVNEPLGVSPTGIPLSWRGLIGLEAAGFSDTKEYSVLALAAIADVPLVDRVFFTARLPFGATVTSTSTGTGAVLGNPMLGTRGVLRPGRRFWVGLGAAVGLPLVSDAAYSPQSTYQAPPIPHGLWNLHEYFPNALPIALALELEGQLNVGLVFRLELEPVLLPPFAGGEGFEFIFQHAGEFQIGRDVGGGLRIQGVALPTFSEIENGADFDDYIEQPTDLYQFALEPFFRLEREKFMLRTGLMMPMDSRLGPPFASSWGLRLQLGMRL